MAFTLTKEFLEELKSFVETRDAGNLSELLAELHPTDLAEIIDKLNREQAAFILTSLDDEIAAEVVTFLDEETREKFMQILSAKEIAEKVIDNLDSDDAADIISELPEEKQREVLSEIEDYEQAKDIVGFWHKFPEAVTASSMGVGYWLYVTNVVLTIWQGLTRRLFPSTHSWVPDVDQRDNG